MVWIEICVFSIISYFIIRIAGQTHLLLNVYDYYEPDHGWGFTIQHDDGMCFHEIDICMNHFFVDYTNSMMQNKEELRFLKKMAFWSWYFGTILFTTFVLLNPLFHQISFNHYVELFTNKILQIFL